MKKPTEIGADDAPEPPGVTWRTPQKSYDSLPQVTGDAIRSARAFLTDGDFWFEDYPEMSHQQWWDHYIAPEYGRDTPDYSEHGDLNTVYFRVSPGGDVVVNHPLLPDADPIDVRQVASALNVLGVPSDATVQWSAGLVADHRRAAEYEVFL